jgi:hypothetical protein
MALGFLLTVAVDPWLVGGFIVLKWAVLLAFLPCLVAWRGAGLAVSWPWLAVLGFGALSIWWAPDRALAFDQLTHLMVFWLAWSLSGSDDVARGMCAGLAVNAAICLMQLAGLYEWPLFNVPSGLFFNRNLLGEIAAPLVVWAGLQRRWWLMAGPLACLTMAPDRAAVVALCVLVVALRRWWRAAALSGLGVVFAVLMAWKGLHDISERETIITQTLAQLTWFGHGIGSFRVFLPYYEFAHCDPLEFVYELGLGALPLAWLGLRPLAGEGPSATRLAFAALMVESLFSFPFQLPTTGVLGACLLGDLWRDGRVVRVNQLASRATVRGDATGPAA